MAAFLGGPAIYSFLKAYDWLAISEPVPNTRTFIVEGWLPDEALRQAATQVKTTDSATVFCTGIPLEMGTLELPYETYADYATSVMVKLGIPQEEVHAVPSKAVTTERTREMARALKTYLQQNPTAYPDKRANILTFATHGRRSRKIFQEELGPEWQIGVISLPDPEANPSRWFLRSRTAKDVLSETVALSLSLVGEN